MSCVAARITNDGLEIAADSITARGWTQRKGDHTKFSKLMEINGMVIGASGLVAEIGAFHAFAATHKPTQATQAAILEYLSEFAEWKKKRTDGAKLEAAYLLWYSGKLFHVFGWGVHDITTFEAIGAGEDFALAAMYLGHSPEEAVKVAIELSVYCEGPIRVIKKQ